MEFKIGQLVELIKPVTDISKPHCILGVGTRGTLSRFCREQDGFRIWELALGCSIWAVNEGQLKAVV